MKTGKVVLVTGGTGGLGQAVVQRIVHQGFAASVVYQNAGEWTRLLGTMPEERERLLGHEGDAALPSFIEDAVNTTVDRFGHLDGMFHLVGGYAYAPLAETSVDVWQRLVTLNLTTAYVAARATAPALTLSRGVMVFVGAQAALTTPPNQSAYNASKAGVLALAQTLAKELRPNGIRVNSIIPDVIDTPANRHTMPNANLEKWLLPDQIADVLIFLLSDAATGVTGANLSMQRS